MYLIISLNYILLLAIGGFLLLLLLFTFLFFIYFFDRQSSRNREREMLCPLVQLPRWPQWPRQCHVKTRSLELHLGLSHDHHLLLLQAHFQGEKQMGLRLEPLRAQTVPQQSVLPLKFEESEEVLFYHALGHTDFRNGRNRIICFIILICFCENKLLEDIYLKNNNIL